MIIAIDFDETLFPTLQKVISVYNKQNNESLMLEQITDYNLYKCLDSNTADKLLKLFCNKEIYNNLQPFDNATRIIQSLIDDGNEIYIATSTDTKNIVWQEQLLQKYFPFIPKENLIRIYNKKLLKCDVLIEDNLDQLIKHKLCHRVVLDKPYNRNVDDFIYDIHRCMNWNQILDEINKIEEEIKSWKSKF